MSTVTYRLVPRDTTTFANPPPLEYTTPDFHVNLKDEVVTFRMIAHYPAVHLAKRSLEPFLRAWEMTAALKFGMGEIGFEYDDAVVVDRNPPGPGEPQIVFAGPITLTAESGMTVRATVQRLEYPQLPREFALSPDVLTFWQRYEGYIEGREPLQGMAYFCATTFESLVKAPGATDYLVSSKIVGTMKNLATTRGDDMTARKHVRERAPLSTKEKSWLEQAVKLLIRRLGQVAAGARLKKLTKADLPRLE